ncbi:hypothetical protein TNCV_432591 [Trichonephila clavipes]|nr:hypothetical protein TNCV_432591 [Trichonephila clavipes]
MHRNESLRRRPASFANTHAPFPGLSQSYIHRQIAEVYATEAMSDSKVQKWIRKLKDGRTNFHDEER